MSQIDQNFRLYLSSHPEIEACYAQGLINRRSLARHLIKEGIAEDYQVEAVIAMLRRYSFSSQPKDDISMFQKMRITVKDKIIIIDFEKKKEILQKLQSLLPEINYDTGETLKVVIGALSIRLFIDEEKEQAVKKLFGTQHIREVFHTISEISIVMPDKVIDARGIISTITKELAMNGIIITELLTSSPELLIYVNEDSVLKAYEIMKRLATMKTCYRLPLKKM